MTSEELHKKETSLFFINEALDLTDTALKSKGTKQLLLSYLESIKLTLSTVKEFYE